MSLNISGSSVISVVGKVFPPLDWGSSVFLELYPGIRMGTANCCKSQAVEGLPYTKRLMTWDKLQSGGLNWTGWFHCFFFLSFFSFILCLCVGTHMLSHTCRNQRTTWKRLVFSSTLWVLGIELKLLVLATSALNPLGHIIKPGISGIQGEEGLWPYSLFHSNACRAHSIRNSLDSVAVLSLAPSFFPT